MAGNPGITLMQMESALNNLHNTMVNEDGSLNLDDQFFELFDELMIKLQQTRELAQNLREKQLEDKK